MTTLEKVMACGILVNYTSRGAFNFQSFIDRVITPFGLEEYAPYLYMYGEYNHFLYLQSNSDEQVQKDKEHDFLIDKWVNLIKQVKFLLENDGDFDMFLSKKNNSKKYHFFTFNNEARVKAKIVDIFLEELSEFEKSIDPINYSPKNEIDIFQVQEKLEDAKNETRKLMGENKGRPTEKNIFANHVNIQSLSYLLRIDRYFSDVSCNDISEIKLRNNDYKFIFAFLDFFKIFKYDDLPNTTTPINIIKQRYKYPPLKNNPFLSFLMERIEIRIEYLKKHYSNL